MHSYKSFLLCNNSRLRNSSISYFRISGSLFSNLLGVVKVIMTAMYWLARTAIRQVIFKGFYF